MSTFNYLSSELDSNIEKIKEKANSNKLKTGVINSLSISLSALITLTLGFDIDPELTQLQKNSALLLGAILTVINGWGVLFDYKKLWVRQKLTLLSLYQLRNELNFRKSQSKESSIEDIFEQYQKIWEVDQEVWKSIVQTSPKEGQSKTMTQ